MPPANLDIIRGRQVVVPLVNRTGGDVIAGDVVVLDSANDEAFVSTVVARETRTVGVVQEAIVSLGTGRVLISGYAPIVNVASAVNRGDYLETSGVAKQAVGSSVRRTGSFGQWEKSGTTPSAILWGIPDGSTTGGGPSTSSVLGNSTGMPPWWWTGDDGEPGPMGPPGPAGAAGSGGGGGGPLTTASAHLTANASYSGGTPTDILTLALTAGTWIVWANATVIMAGNGNSQCRLTDGTNVIGDSGFSQGSGAYADHAMVSQPVVIPGGGGTIHFQFWTNTGGTPTVVANTLSGTAATVITAIKLDTGGSGSGATAVANPIQLAETGGAGASLVATFGTAPLATSKFFALFSEVVITGPVTAITQTNVTWTLLRRVANGSTAVEIWKGVPSGTPGTTVTATLGTSVATEMTVSEWPAAAGLTGTVDKFFDNTGSGPQQITAQPTGIASTALVFVIMAVGSGTPSVIAVGPYSPHLVSALASMFWYMGYKWASTGTSPVLIPAQGNTVWANTIVSVI